MLHAKTSSPSVSLAGLKRGASALLCGAFALAAIAALPAPAKADIDDWPGLKRTVFDNRDVIEEDGVVILDTPQVVQDAALVPITVRVPPEVKEPIKSLTIVIDKNPMPVLAKLTFGPAAGTGGERRFTTRARIDTFSHIRAVVETEDGKLHMTTKFIAAAGGCAAMNAKDPTTLTDGLGKMIVKTFEPALPSTPIWEGMVMLKHPNFSGLQINPNTGDFIAARFIYNADVKRDGELVFNMRAGSAISTNPNFRFTFGRGEENVLTVKMTDTDETVFEAHSEPSGT
ncbi:quinoprotein dehydrogenase-associated SoxYZ-like carrier [Methyloligella sp. 2.7D]|uniref:quinoprotein dehydrogenase-associated SoxYZ-like carrier n=1 Tax=unclassified Methyloligella TaxID=2625955 RepID=UPI00157BF263|nr:quinoprotein dehydrogenase-associated SoxYZ-like carrier [Methyloligella sp. GL2]QKP76979.1 quinoprotein dehydrogenase-associated SoxYZ-like carrier [Methyloligella sp. GL2]